MTREEMHDLILGLAVVALGYAIYQHQKAVKAAGTNTGIVPPPNGNTGFVPIGYDPNTHDYTSSLDALLQGVVNSGADYPIVIG